MASDNIINNKKSDLEFTRNVTSVKVEEDPEVCQILEDFDQWMTNYFRIVDQNHDQKNLTAILSSGNLEDVESGIVCDGSESHFKQRSSSCTFCQQKRCSGATHVGTRIQYRCSVAEEGARHPNMLTIPPCVAGTFIFISVSVVLIIFVLWLSRFFNLGIGNTIDGSTPNTIPNWWNPLPYRWSIIK